MMSTTYVVQARMGSTRLPGKILRPLYKGKSILDLQIEKLLKHVNAENLVIATSTNAKDNVLERYGIESGIQVYRGSEDDVLMRFISVLDGTGASHCVRVCADNPFLSTILLEQLLTSEESDYVSHRSLEGTPAMQTHVGVFSEVIKTSALQKILRMTEEPLYREHVTNYIYSHAEHFDISWIDMPQGLGALEDIRLTVDTQEDFNNVQSVLEELGEEGLDNLELLTKYLATNSELRLNMQKQIIRNGK